MVHPSIILHKVSLHKIYLDLLKISRPTGEGGIYNNRFFDIFVASVTKRIFVTQT